MAIVMDIRWLPGTVCRVTTLSYGSPDPGVLVLSILVLLPSVLRSFVLFLYGSTLPGTLRVAGATNPNPPRIQGKNFFCFFPSWPDSTMFSIHVEISVSTSQNPVREKGDCVDHG